MPTETSRVEASLDVFGNPSSVAVVGASEHPAKWGYWLSRGALIGQGRRNVYLVNRRADMVLGQPSFNSLADLPEVPELVALCVPAAQVPTVVEEALAIGVRGFLGIAAGVVDEKSLAERIKASGARMVGANSLGIFDASTELQLTWGDFTPGPLAIISQSGQLGSELAAIGLRCGVGVSKFISIGNQSDVQAAELLLSLVDHEPTRIVALYLESFTSAQTLFETLRVLRSAGKPVLLLTVGSSAASSRLARSHTGSMTSPLDAVDAACRQAGVLRVETPFELINVARTYLAAPAPSGTRVGVVGDSGGQSAIASDVAANAGLAVPVFSGNLAASIDSVLPADAACSNPVDLAGAGEQDLDNYAVIVEEILGSPETDAVVLTGYFGCYGSDNLSLTDKEREVLRRLAKAVQTSGKPLIVHTMSSESRILDLFWENGVPAFDTIDAAMTSLSGLAALLRQPRDLVVVREGSVPEVKPGYWASREILSDVGVNFPRGHRIESFAELVVAADELVAPWVLKAGWLEHKSEVGGVVTGIQNRHELLERFDDMQARLGVGEYVLEEQDMRANSVEILIGARRDEDFGPLITVGAGGTEAELHRDVSMELAPVDQATALDMIHNLRCLPLLEGWRGKPLTDIAALAEAVVQVSEVIALNRHLSEIEINPIRVAPEGILAVDALIVAADKT